MHLDPHFYGIRHSATCTCLHIRQVVHSNSVRSANPTGSRVPEVANQPKGLTTTRVQQGHPCCSQIFLQCFQIEGTTLYLMHEEGQRAYYSLRSMSVLLVRGPCIKSSGQGPRKPATVFRGIKHQRGGQGAPRISCHCPSQMRLRLGPERVERRWHESSTGVDSGFEWGQPMAQVCAAFLPRMLMSGMSITYSSQPSTAIQIITNIHFFNVKQQLFPNFVLFSGVTQSTDSVN